VCRPRTSCGGRPAPVLDSSLSERGRANGIRFWDNGGGAGPNLVPRAPAICQPPKRQSPPAPLWGGTAKALDHFFVRKARTPATGAGPRYRNIARPAGTSEPLKNAARSHRQRATGVPTYSFGRLLRLCPRFNSGRIALCRLRIHVRADTQGRSCNVTPTNGRVAGE